MLSASLKFINKTDDAIEGIDKNVSIAVQKSLVVMERNIKGNTPTKHGTLKRSITMRLNNPFEGEIYTSPLVDGKEVDYAVYVEYGTRYMAPRAMFRKGVAQSEEQIQQHFADELKKKVV